MSQHKKSLNRLLDKPKDFEWSELVSLLGHFGFEMFKGDGSRRRFIHKATKQLIILHEPHPEKIIKKCYIKDIINALTEGGFIK